jgi:S-adenosylmethionine decarboxylase
MTTGSKTKYAGIHLLIEFWGAKIIEDAKKISAILVKTAKVSRNTPLGVKIHKFSPHGITGFILLAESHISIHTWPEKKYVAVDIFSCGINSQPYKGLDYLKEEFQPEKVKVREIKRGL